MPKILICSGVASLVLLPTILILAYYDGRSFGSLMLQWDLFLGLGSFAALITLLVAIVAILYQSLRSRVSKKWNLVSGGFIAAIFGLYALPIPSFTQGMHDSLRERFRPEELHAFAEDAGTSPIQWFITEDHDARVRELQREHSRILEISELSPRLTSHDGRVEIFYGGALVGHWGVAFGPSCPRDYLTEALCKEVYDGVWVFSDYY